MRSAGRRGDLVTVSPFVVCHVALMLFTLCVADVVVYCKLCWCLSLLASLRYVNQELVLVNHNPLAQGTNPS